jgi:hypothetical protein
MTTTGQAQENREYVRRLLWERQPGFAATLESAERQVDQELSHPAAGERSQVVSCTPQRCAEAAPLPHEGSP